MGLVMALGALGRNMVWGRFDAVEREAWPIDAFIDDRMSDELSSRAGQVGFSFPRLLVSGSSGQARG
ncbi:hypothetical protein D3C71_1702360 [compost metagenome]